MGGPVGKNFSDDLDDGVEEANRLEFINQRSVFFCQDESNRA